MCVCVFTVYKRRKQDLEGRVSPMVPSRSAAEPRLEPGVRLRRRREVVKGTCRGERQEGRGGERREAPSALSPPPGAALSVFMARFPSPAQGRPWAIWAHPTLLRILMGNHELLNVPRTMSAALAFQAGGSRECGEGWALGPFPGFTCSSRVGTLAGRGGGPQARGGHRGCQGPREGSLPRCGRHPRSASPAHPSGTAAPGGGGQQWGEG